MAARHLAGRGWRILARNWRPDGTSRGLELDIIAMDGGSLVFVEVKTRRQPEEEPGRDRPSVPTDSPGKGAGGSEGARPLRVPVHLALTPAKRGRLARAAGHYLTAHGRWDASCRFDLICIELFSNGQSRLEHHCNVIELGQVVGSGNAAWQPW